MIGASATRDAIAGWPPRRLHAAAVIIWLCACIALGLHATGVRKEMTTATQRPLIIIGSSTASGIGASHRHGWVEFLRGVGYDITSHAVAGSTIFDALDHGCVLTERCLPPGAQDPLLLVHFPTNEIALGRSSAEILDAYARIAQWAEAHDVDFVFISVQPRNMDATSRGRLHELDRLLARSYPDHYVSVYSALATRDGRIRPQYSAGDNIHLNDGGHAMIAQEVHRYLLSRHSAESARGIDQQAKTHQADRPPVRM